jgi:GT2 family glycosyltransferase
LPLKETSVIISAYSTERLPEVLSCIESLRNQTYPPKETILVLDPNPQLVETYSQKIPSHVKLVVSDAYGLSNARNSGIRNSQAEIVTFIDDDAVADKRWLENLMKNYDDPKVIGAGGLIKPLWQGKRPPWFPEELDWTVGCSYKGLPEQRQVVRNPIGASMSFKKSIFDKVGYFRTDVGRSGKSLLAGEEAELSTRILEQIPTSKIMFEPKAVVYHRVTKKRASLSYLWRRSFYEGISKALITKSTKSRSRALSTENQYLRYLLTSSFPRRLTRIYLLSNLTQLVVISISTIAVFLGFITGKIRT